MAWMKRKKRGPNSGTTALDRDCTHCGAGAGEPCIGPKGKPLPGGKTHKARATA